MALSKEAYNDRKDKGLCVQCGDSANGKLRCETCRERNRLARVARRAKLKSGGLCTECKEPASPGFILCDTCRRARTVVANARYRRNKANNKCRLCGKDSGGEARCPEHKVKYKEWRRENESRKPLEDPNRGINNDAN